MPFKIILPVSVIISILVGSLTMYYNDPRHKVKKEEEEHHGEQNSNYVPRNTRQLLPNVIFAVAYVVLLILLGIFYGSNYENPEYNELFVSWQQFSPADVMKLISGIGLSFFFPGYAIITIILNIKKQVLGTLPKILLGYIFSIGIVGFLAYIQAILGYPVSDIKLILIFLQVIILVLFLQQLDIVSSIRLLFSSGRTTPFGLTKKRYKIIESLPQIIVFGSLLGLVIMSTFVLYSGVIVGDQWFHHGRALQFISGNYKTITDSNTDFSYPPLLSAFLSSFFVLADVPTVNAYASIGFFNIISVFAFYYFLQNWNPFRKKRAALLGAVLFVLSSGFGWIYAINAIADDSAQPSQNSALVTILAVSKQTYDIRSPSTFLLASHPDIGTGLQLIVLPIGFVLLGILKDDKIKPTHQYYYSIIISIILFFGIFSHDEIYFFVIIACLLPIVFKLDGKGFVYLGILSANGIAIIANYLFLGMHLSATMIMGVPLIIISFVFVAIAWAFYSGRILEKLYYITGIHKITVPKSILRGNASPHMSHLRFTLSVILVSVAFYLYLFSYITWAELSTEDIETQTSELFPRNVPWYLYPMKLGLTGLLGLCFVLSYIFRKFEKEVFVFGVIVIVAIITGPYYDEHRFNKYVMVGLAGFASLFIYDIIIFINKRIHYGPIISGIFIGVVIGLASLSTLMYVSFQASAIETKNLDLLWEGRRNFPSPSELQVLQFLRGNAISEFDSSEIYNIVTWPNAYQLKLGLIGKFEGFLGIPVPKMLQSPLALNASDLESFYNLLAGSDTRFIVVPTAGVIDKGNLSRAASSGLGQNMKTGDKVKELAGEEHEIKQILDSTNILNFAFVNFNKMYQNGNFVVLSVPSHIIPPSSSGDIALINVGTEGDLTSNNKVVKAALPYTKEFFNRISDSEFAKVSEDKENLLLNTFNKSQTLWSRDMEDGDGNLDYLEAKFLTLDRNRGMKNNECGIIWENEGGKKYYVRIRDDKLEFSETPAPKDRFAFENLRLRLNEQTLYTLKLIFSENALYAYVDDTLGLQVPNEFYQGGKARDISRIGIKCSGNIAEFEPIKFSKINQVGDGDLNDLQQRQQNYKYHYPLTMLALSGSKYDTFLPNDYSMFSKNNIILTAEAFDDYYENNGSSNESINIDKFLDYVKRGGQLTVISTENTIGGWFEEAFGIKSIGNNNTEFNTIVELTEPRVSVNLSGTALRVDSTSPDIDIRSYYQKNGERISPFVLEKSYGRGKIVLINAAGLFDAISREPEKYFLKLANMSQLVGIDQEKNNTNTRLTLTPPIYNLGELRFNGNSTIKSSSLLLPSGNEYIPNRYFVQDVSILPTNRSDGNVITYSANTLDVSNNKSITRDKMDLVGKMKPNFKNIVMKNLELQGLYNATIQSSGTLNLPSQWSPYSKSNYVGLSVPGGFDMILTLSNDSSARITLENNTERIIEFVSLNTTNDQVDGTPDNAQVYFHNIRPDGNQENQISVLMKRPEIKSYGNATFESLFQGREDFDLFKGIEGNPFETGKGSIDLKLSNVNNYYSSSKSKHTTDYVTYIDSLDIDTPPDNPLNQQVELRIPGDVSDAAKQESVIVPWEKAFLSNTNIAAVAFFFAAGTIVLILWPRLKNRTRVQL